MLLPGPANRWELWHVGWSECGHNLRQGGLADDERTFVGGLPEGGDGRARMPRVVQQHVEQNGGVNGRHHRESAAGSHPCSLRRAGCHAHAISDRKSTRLNSSRLGISYAVFCLKKKK